MMWQVHFLLGWEATGSVLATFFGGAAAVILAVLSLALLLMVIAAILNAVFNVVTDAMAGHWEKVGKRPGTRWAEIIAKGRSRKNDGE